MAEQKEKKKKSVLSKILTAVLSLVLLVVFAVVGFGIFLKVKYDINPLALIGQAQRINAPVDTEALVKNVYSDEDLTSANAKVDSISLTTAYKTFSDKELAAYINNKLQTQEGGVKVNFGSEEINLLDYGFALLEYKFSDIPETPGDHFADIEFIVKIDTQKLKDQKMNSFPVSLFKGLVPNQLYFVVTTSVDKSAADGAGAYDYQINDAALGVNGLDASDTENVFKLLNMFSGIGASSNFAKTLADSFVGAILGENGVYGAMKDSTEHPAQGYSFEHTEMSDNWVVYFVSTTETRTISFVTTHGSASPIVYNITYNTITLPVPTANGYLFDGWYKLVGIEETKFTSIDIREHFENMTFTAKWSLINYTISYDLNGGEIEGEYKTTYTIEDADYTLPTPTKTVGLQTFTFRGWAGTGIDGVENPKTITHGTYGDLSFVACWVGDTRTVTLVVSGETYNTDRLNAIDMGDTLDEDTFFYGSEVGLGGYYVPTWYSNSAKTVEFDFDSNILEDTILYGSGWEYIINDVLFSEYKDTFDAARSSEEVTVSSRAMLVAFIDYVIFNNVKDEIKIYFNTSYIANDQTAQNTEFDEAFNQYSNLNDRLGVGFTYMLGYNRTFGTWYRLFYISTSDMDTAKVEFNHDNNVDAPSTPTVYEQQDYAYKVQSAGREAEYDDFNINNVPRTIGGITVSEQLFWAMQSGYKPVCASGSVAETVYNKAKEILREICDDTMDDITKLKAIYEWLILNVQYDYDAAAWLEDSTIADAERQQRNADAHNYVCWSAEGALIYHKAVCEGFAKSLLIMARIEGIPVIYVTGNGHAWNKVYLEGKWYGIDATHGNPGNKTRQMETVSYVEFLFTDEQKENMGYVSVNHTECVANTDYNEYERDYDFESQTFDLVVGSSQEFALILKNVAAYETEVGTHFTVNVMVLYSNNSLFNTWLSYALSQSGLSSSGQFVMQDGRNGAVPSTGSTNPHHNNITYTILLNRT